jgi:hypothetical protein
VDHNKKCARCCSRHGVECRAFPPHPLDLPDGTRWRVWPTVRSNDWCDYYTEENDDAEKTDNNQKGG